MNAPAFSSRSKRRIRHRLAALGIISLLAAPGGLRAAGGAFNVFIPVRTSQSQISDFTTTLNFHSPGGTLIVDSSAGVIGGNVNFFDFTELAAGFGSGIQGGVQTFHDFAELNITSTRAIVGGRQDFYDSSSLNVGNFNYQGVYGGEQTFHDSSVARLSTSYAFYGGTQTFRDSSHAELYSTGAVQAVTLHLADEASLDLYAPQALASSTDLVFDRATPGTTGGIVQLGGRQVTIGRLTSINDGGLITNRNTSGSLAALTVVTPVGTDVFGGRIEDGVNGGPTGGGPVSLFKKGPGTLVLSAAQGFTGRTSVEKGTLRLNFSAANAPVGNMLRGDNAGITLGGAQLEVMGKNGAANSQAFNSLAITGGASRVVLAPQGAASLNVHFGSYALLTQVSPGAADFTIPSGSAVKFSNVATSSVPPWITLNNGTAFAALTPDGASGDQQLTPFTAYDSTLGGAAYSSTQRLVKFDQPAALTASGTNWTGLLVSPAVGNHVSKALFSAVVPPVAPGAYSELYIQQWNTAAPLELEYNVTYNRGDANMSDSHPFTFVKSGPGELILGGGANFFHNVYVQSNPGSYQSELVLGRIDTLELPVRLWVNEGKVTVPTEIVGDITVGQGTTLGGSGHLLGVLWMRGGSMLKPGKSPGLLEAAAAIWEGGSAYEWELNDTLGTAGTDPGWDLLSVAGLLDITASAANKFTIDLRSLNFANLGGDAAHFDPLQDYSWAIAIAGGGFAINGTPITDLAQFDPDLFAIDRGGFTNTDDGTFTLTLDPTLHDLLLTYTAPSAVPEPGNALFGLAAAAGLLRRGRPKSRSSRDAPRQSFR